MCLVVGDFLSMHILPQLPKKEEGKGRERKGRKDGREEGRKDGRKEGRKENN